MTQRRKTAKITEPSNSSGSELRFPFESRLEIRRAESRRSLSLVTGNVINEKDELRRTEGDGTKMFFSLELRSDSIVDPTGRRVANRRRDPNGCTAVCQAWLATVLQLPRPPGFHCTRAESSARIPFEFSSRVCLKETFEIHFFLFFSLCPGTH